MAQVLWFTHRHTRLYASLGTLLLVPPLVCWLALVLLLVGLRPAAALLQSISMRGGPLGEVAILLVCPLLAVASGFAAIRRVPRGRKGAEAWCWALIGAGVVFAICAVFAALRP